MGEDGLDGNDLKELEALFISCLQIEWEGMRAEAGKGNITPLEKTTLLARHKRRLDDYLGRIN